MEIVNTVKVNGNSGKSGNGNSGKSGNGSRKRSRKGLTKEQIEEGKKAFKKINKLCKNVKGRKVSKEEFNRYNELRNQLRLLRLI